MNRMLWFYKDMLLLNTRRCTLYSQILPMPACSSHISFQFANSSTKVSAKMTQVPDPEIVNRFLEKASTKHFYIEYQRYFFNHAAHGIIALSRLGADESRLSRFVDWVVTDKLPPDHKKAGKTLEVNAGNFQQFVGKKTNYYGLCNYFTQKLESEHKGDIRSLVKAEFPALSNGLSGSALHGSIHIGYGLVAENQLTVVEGLAFLAFASVPFKPSQPWKLKDGDLSLDQLVEFASQQQDLISWMKEESGNVSATYPTSDFGRRMKVLLSQKADVIQSVAEKLHLPADLFTTDGVSSKVGEWLVRTALYVYAHCKFRNNFYLLHGVTCAWGLTQILPLLSDAQRLDITGTFLGVLCAVYLTITASALAPLDSAQMKWDELLRIAMVEDRDEHNFKLLHIAYELAQRDDTADDLKQMCLCAANDAMNKPFSRLG